ncbi:MAG: GDSL-type esterase/lipase family protein [Candidatus Zipacnadales bacterium]
MRWVASVCRASFGAAGILYAAVFPLLPLLMFAPHQPPDMTPLAPQAARLRAKLREGPGPVRIIVFGDSLAAGWGPRDPENEAYAAVLETAVRARYPRCKIELIVAGGPGDPSDVGLLRLRREVLSRRPDVVVIQFGGNDERLGRQPGELTDDLITMVERIRQELPDALCIIATPPMNDAAAQTPFVRAAQLAAKAVEVPVADFDRALREADRDYRGPFCWGGHPGGYAHLIMGRELLQAWNQLLGTPSALTIEIEGYSKLLKAAESPSLRVAVTNTGLQPLAAELEFGPAFLVKHERFELEAGTRGDVTEDLVLPQSLPGNRTWGLRMWAVARAVAAEASAIDMKWLAVAPVIIPDRVGTQLDQEALTWHRLGPESLVMGKSTWEGDADLSARFAVALRAQELIVIVDVQDDDLNVAQGQTSISEGDSVELCLDLRLPKDQAKPVYSPEVALLLVKPATSPTTRASWQPLDELTPQLSDVSAMSTLTREGYMATLSIPLSAFERGGEGLDGVGFDIHVNDSDFGLGRETQLVWAGTADNYLNPAALGALANPTNEPPQWRVSLR